MVILIIIQKVKNLTKIYPYIFVITERLTRINPSHEVVAPPEVRDPSYGN